MAETEVGGGNTRGKIYVQDSAPTVGQGVVVGAIWSDTTNNVVKRATSVDPVTFTDIEGGQDHDLGGGNHNSDTLANLNSKVSDGTLVDKDSANTWTAKQTINADVDIDGDLTFTGPQSVGTSSGDLTLSPAGDVTLPSSTRILLANGEVVGFNNNAGTNPESGAMAIDLNDRLFFRAGGDANMYMHPTGEVTIGTSSTSGEKLEVNGNITLSSAGELSTQSGDLTLNPAGDLIAASLPTADPTKAGALWNDSGTVKVSSG